MLAVIGVGLGLLSLRPQGSATVPIDLPAPCRNVTFEAARFVVCELPRADWDVRVAHTTAPRGPDATVPGLLATTSPAPALAMNAGMYGPDLKAIGLLIEDGVELAPINLNEGPGNFHLMPNGVFFIDTEGRPGVRTSAAWASAPPATRFATQSGPMLVIDGQLHPAFQPDGQSRQVRNGVGVRGEITVLAISRDRVSFGLFARLFRDELKSPNALYLDGFVSALATPDQRIVGGDHPAGPVITATTP